jgi:hypothetical protein
MVFMSLPHSVAFFGCWFAFGVAYEIAVVGYCMLLEQRVE